MDAPPRPKRKVKKVVDGWVNIHPPKSPEERIWMGFLWCSENQANEYQGMNRLGPAYHLIHEYEVEE